VSFTVEEFGELRPFLYHVTARENLRRLQRTHRLETAEHLLRGGGRADLLRQRRPTSVSLLLDGETAVLKDQRPLIEANVSVVPPWTFGDFVEFLNQHVYFWPGDAIGPIVSGVRLLAHYAEELPLVLRVRLSDLLNVNPGAVALFSPYNSGAPRMQRGEPVRRGPDLFRPAHAARRKRFEVIEVAFRGTVTLPSTAEVRGAPEQWIRLSQSPYLTIDSTRERADI
jgi:hypothetical protein